MFVCLSVGLPACLPACLSACLSLSLCMPLYVCMPKCVYVCICVCLWVYECVCEQVYMCILYHKCVYVYVCMYVRLPGCLPSCLPSCLPACLCLCLCVCLAVCLSACLSFRLYALMYQYFLTVSLGNTLPFRGSVFIARFLHHARFTKWFDLIVCKWCNHPNGPFLTRFGPPVMHLSCNTILCRAMRGFRMRQPDHLLWAGLWKFLVVLPVEWPA